MESFSNFVSDIVRSLFQVDVVAEISRPDPRFGDLATNVAMQIVKQVGKNPRDIAEQITTKLRESSDFTDVSIAGPGFINLRLSDKYLAAELNKMIAAPNDYGKSSQYDNKIVVTEFSDPNPFKELHVGHLYTTIVGEAISRLIETAGGEVHRVNFGGDVGLHVAKAMWGIITNLGGENPDKLNEIPVDERSRFLSQRYVEGANAYEDDEIAKEKIIEYNAQVYKLHSENDRESPFAQIYWTCRAWSYEYFNKFYDEIGVKFEKYYPESETTPIGIRTVEEQRKRGVYEDSDGAVVFKGEKYGLHTRVFINRNGLPTYEAKDVGLSIKKWDDYHFDESVIITGNDIIEYMKVVLKSIEQFQPQLAQRTKHMTHGNIKLAGVTKMSSRKGNVLRAVDVIEMAKNALRETQDNADMIQVLGSIKYAFLKNTLGPDMIFDAKESVSMVGNSGPYLQYAAVRAKSILRGLTTDFNGDYPTNFDEFERALLVKLTEFSDAIKVATQELSPHLICAYLYELAQTFNRFYENSRVAGDVRENLRAQLALVYAKFLERGLDILGIAVSEKM